MAAGDHRWVAQVVDHVVFADPDNVEARALQADALEQLGYQAESAPWRNFYLTGAQELRAGDLFDLGNAGLGGFAAAMTTEMLFDAMAVRLVPDRLAAQPWWANWHVTDRQERHVVGLSNGTLFHRPDRTDPDAPCSITSSSATLIALIDHATTVDDALADGSLSVEGDAEGLVALIGAVDVFARMFPIVTP